MNKRFLALSLLFAFLFSPLAAGADKADGGTVVRLWTDNVLGKEAGGKEKSTTAKKGDGTLIKLANMKATAECSFSRRERKACAEECTERVLWGDGKNNEIQSFVN